MSNSSLEVSTMVWLDDDVGEWVYTVINSLDGYDDQIIAWGTRSSREDAVNSAVAELTTYLRGA